MWDINVLGMLWVICVLLFKLIDFGDGLIVIVILIVVIEVYDGGVGYIVVKYV